MCTTLPPVLVTWSGSRSSCRRFADLEVFLQLLPRSSTGERMNPYTSLWTGVTPGDGPQELHVVLLDNGRTRVLERRGRPAGAALHPLQRVPERLPGLLAHRRPRVRLGLPGADRRDPHPAADRDRERDRRCRSPPASAAPVTRSARSRSTSRPCSCTCAGEAVDDEPDRLRDDWHAAWRRGLRRAAGGSSSRSAWHGSRSVRSSAGRSAACPGRCAPGRERAT